MTVDWKDPETRQLVIQGRRQALLEGNLEAVELFNHNRRLGRPPTLETVHSAVMEAGCNPSIVYDTLRTAYRWSSHIDAWDYVVLDQWCDQRIQENDIKGLWLREILQALRHSEMGAYEKSMDRELLFDKLVHEAASKYSNELGNELIRNEPSWNKVRYGVPHIAIIPGQISAHSVRFPIFQNVWIKTFQWT